MKIKTIKISEKNWRLLTKLKLDLDCKNLDEVMQKILKIIPANKLEKGENKK